MIISKKQSGITLIALAVTIIVVMILAGVSLSSLSGQENTITKAQDVKSAVDLKEEKDAILIAIQETLILSNNGKLEKKSFKKHLEEHLDIISFDYNEDDKLYTIRTVSNNKVYVIDDKGNIKEEN